MVVETAVGIRWGDMDALGHVNNAVYLSYLETAREPWVAQVLAGEITAFALRRVEIDFLSQLRFEDGEVRVAVELAGVGTTSVRTRERVTAGSDGRLVAEARAVIVHLDARGDRAAPLPEGVRARLRQAA